MTLRNKVLLLASIGFSYRKVVNTIDKLVETGKFTPEEAVDLLLEKNNIKGINTDEQVLE